MQVRELMSSPVVTVREQATAGEAADLMLKHQVSCLPVVDGKGRLVGIVTHADFEPHPKFLALADNLYTLLGEFVTPQNVEQVARKLRSKRVTGIMSQDVITVKEDAPASDIGSLMLQHHVSRLPVTRGKKLVGIVTRHDLLKFFTWGR